MDNKKFEQLIDLIINENEEQARALFHDIVVEKSREIYEEIMNDEMEEDGSMGGQVGQMMDEISAEHEGMVEAEDEEIDFDDDGDDEIVDIDSDDESEHEDEELEDRVTDLEDKLDELMAEFEEIMADHDSEDGDDMSDDDMADDDMSDEEMNEMEMDEMEMDEDPMMEAITLKKVSVTHGDNGQNTKSTSLQNSGQAGMDSRPVKFSGSAEANPTSPKKPSNIYSKGETQVKDATNWKNAPAQNNADLESTPKPVTKDGATGTKSPVAESRKTSTKRRV